MGPPYSAPNHAPVVEQKMIHASPRRQRGLFADRLIFITPQTAPSPAPAREPMNPPQNPPTRLPALRPIVVSMAIENCSLLGVEDTRSPGPTGRKPAPARVGRNAAVAMGRCRSATPVDHPLSAAVSDHRGQAVGSGGHVEGASDHWGSSWRARRGSLDRADAHPATATGDFAAARLFGPKRLWRERSGQAGSGVARSCRPRRSIQSASRALGP